MGRQAGGQSVNQSYAAFDKTFILCSTYKNQSSDVGPFEPALDSE